MVFGPWTPGFGIHTVVDDCPDRGDRGSRCTVLGCALDLDLDLNSGAGFSPFPVLDAPHSSPAGINGAARWSTEASVCSRAGATISGTGLELEYRGTFLAPPPNSPIVQYMLPPTSQTLDPEGTNGAARGWYLKGSKALQRRLHTTLVLPGLVPPTGRYVDHGTWDRRIG